MTNHRRALAALSLLALSLAASGAGPLQAQVKDHRSLNYPAMRPFTVPQPERVELPNGMVLLLLEDHELPLVEITARIRTGTRLDPPAKVGLANIVGQVMRTGGTKRMNGDQIDDFLESRAAQVETGVNTDSGFASLSCLSQDFPEVVKVFAEILREPVFADEKIAIAKTAVRAGIARRNDNPQTIIFREGAKLLYGADSPYAGQPEYATLDSITREDLVAWHKTYVQPNRILMGVSGDFNAKEMAGTLRTLFKDWPKGPAAKDPEPGFQAATKPGLYYVPKEDMTQSNILLGHMGIRKDNPDFFAVEVLNEAFGGSFSARLFSNVRSRKGLAYSVNGGVRSNYDYPGVFQAFMTTKTETTAAGIDALMEEIEGIVKNPPSEAEVKRAKESILNSFVFNFTSTSQILDQQLLYAYFGYPPDFLARYRENIEKVTTADVARVAAKYIHKDQLITLVVGPSKGHDRPLESFGKVARVDITIPEPKAAAAPAATAGNLAKGKEIWAKVPGGLGGPGAVSDVKALRFSTNATVKTPQGELALKIVQTMAFPDRMRQELNTPMGQMIRVVAPDEAFMTSPMGVQPMPDSQKADLMKTLQRHPVMLARNDADTVKAQHVGQEAVDGTPTEILALTVGADAMRLWVDPSNGRILRQGFRGTGPAGPADFVATFSDFRPAGSLTLPYKIVVAVNGETQQTLLVEEVAVNPAVDAALFAKPPAAAQPAGEGK
ncbi:MAG: M16 family metallopeptidase [Candidatus Polarisedimenticolia bacterium]